jgi:peptidyl-prolyl cis-trans isomerase A (cyclophilin A)
MRYLWIAALLAIGVAAANRANAQPEESVEVLMETAMGAIRLELYPARAPVTVANFLRHVDGGYYDGATFYRTVTYENDNGNPKIEVIQGGIGDGSPFDPIPHEDTATTGILHTDGVISMARGDVGTASSEFFIVIGDQHGLDNGEVRNPDRQGFAAFGRVIDGMDVVRAINAAPADGPSDNPYTAGQIIADPVEIRSMRRADEGS